jgi:CHAT domain-containing protein/predicted negative regulator of RcsB-dependent stress response
LKLLEQALHLAREAGLKKEEGDWLTGRGLALLRRGDYSDALVNYRAARDIYEKAEMKRELVEMYQYLADTYLRLGDTLSSRRNLEKALSLSESIGYKRGSVASLTLLGDLARQRGRFEEALSHYLRARTTVQELGEQAQEASLLIQLGRLETERSKYGEAQAALQQALEIARRLGTKAYEAMALFSHAELLRRQGQIEASLPIYRDGIELAVPLQNPEVTWRLYHGQGRAFEALERYEEAIAAYRAAIELIETTRGRIREEPFRAGFMEDKYEVYVDLVRLLVKLGRIADAFIYVERSRARAYLDLLGSSHIEVGPTGQAGRQEERALRKKIEQLYELLEREQTKPHQERRTGAVETVTRELAEAQRQYAVLLAELRSTDPEYASLVVVKPLGVSQVQGLLGGREALLEYFFANDELTVFFITPDRVAHFQQPVREKDLRAKVELFRDRLRPGATARDDWRGPAESLRELLMGPMEEKDLLAGVDHLYIVPQGVLHYLPFAALWKPGPSEGEFLVERYQVAYLPSASTLSFCRNKKRPTRRALLAMAPGSTGLRFAQQEVEAVRQLFPAAGVVATQSEASERLCKRHCGDYTVLHFATHGHLNKSNPLFSRIDLEPTPDEDGRLEVFEIMGLQLEADLVALSACNTALGSGYFSEVPAGDDWVSLTRAFIFAGTPSVVASLWEVDDRSTTELMKSFYRYLPKMSKAEALAQAQRDLLQPGSASQQDLTSALYRNPYYWAAFVLVGDAQ